MRKIIYYIASSADGYIAHQDGSVTDFLMEGEHADDFVSHFQNYDTVLMGRGTYEAGFQYGIKPGEPAYKGLKHVIISKSLNFESNNEVQLVKNNAVDYIKQLKSQNGKQIWLCGGGDLAGRLVNEGLIDEIMLKVNPIAIGQGISLFGNLNRTLAFDLVDSKAYNNGVMLLHYNVKAV